MKKPKFISTRIDNLVRLDLLNREGKTAFIYRSRFQNEELIFIDEINSDVFEEFINPDWVPSYQIRYDEPDLSLIVVEDFPDADPPYVEVQAAPGTTITETSYQINPSWSDPVTVLTFTVDGSTQGVKSIRQFT